ncbi:aromatic motif membrane protein [Mycoplasma sp. 1573]
MLRNKKFFILSLLSLLSLTTISFASVSCSIKFVDENPIPAPIKKVDENSNVNIDSFLKNFVFANKGDAEINTFKESQKVSQEWISDLNKKITEYQSLFSENTEANNLKMSNLETEISQLLSDKWYWYLTHLNHFDFAFSGVDSQFEQIPKLYNFKPSVEYSSAQKDIIQNPSKYVSLTYRSKWPEVESIVPIENVDSDASGVFAAKINQNFFIRLWLTEKNGQPSVEVPFFIYRFSEDKQILYTQFQHFYHQFIYHTNTLGDVAPKLFGQWEQFVKQNGFWLNYHISKWNDSVGPNKNVTDLPVGQ